MNGSLEGARVIVTRERPGHLADMLRARGAEVHHVALISIEEPLDGGADLSDALDRVSTFDWVVVTSPNGAERVGRRVADDPSVRLAAVGTATAATLASLAGRAVDLVPSTQTGAALAVELVAVAEPGSRVLLAVADRASEVIEHELRAAGHEVRRCVAYRTVVRRPCADPPAADAVVFASGSSAVAWAGAFGTRTPSIVVAIGPSTSAAATEVGLKVTAVAADSSLDGLVACLESEWARAGQV